MSLNFDLTSIPEDVRLIVAEEDDTSAGIKKGDRIMSPVTNALIWSTMAVGIGVINDDTAAEFAARLDFLQKLDGPMLSAYDAEADTWSPRPLTLEDVQAHKGLSTNVFPMERRGAWIKRTAERSNPFQGVTQPTYPRR